MLPFQGRRTYQPRSSTCLDLLFCWSRWDFLLSTLCGATCPALRHRSSSCWQLQLVQSCCKILSSKLKVLRLLTEAGRAKSRKRLKKCWSCWRSSARRRVSSWAQSNCCCSACHSLSIVHRILSYTKLGFFFQWLLVHSVGASKFDSLSLPAKTCSCTNSAHCLFSICV
jgi:hypothetical protein